MVNPVDTVRLVIISVPPPLALSELTTLTAAVAAATRSCTAATYPPHVTLRTGALVPADRLEAFVEGFAAHCAGVRGCRLRTGAPLAFSDPAPFVGLSIDADPTLLALHRALLAYQPWRKGPQAGFHPHLSLAYGDLTADALPAATALIAHVPPGRWSWVCDRVGLYRREAGHWRCWRTLPLAPP